MFTSKLTCVGLLGPDVGTGRVLSWDARSSMLSRLSIRSSSRCVRRAIGVVTGENQVMGERRVLCIFMMQDFKGLEGELPKKEAEYETTLGLNKICCGQHVKTDDAILRIVESLEKIRHPLSYSWGVVSHLNNAAGSNPDHCL